MTEVGQEKTAGAERFRLRSGTKTPVSVQKPFSTLFVIDPARLKREI